VSCQQVSFVPKVSHLKQVHTTTEVDRSIDTHISATGTNKAASHCVPTIAPPAGTIPTQHISTLSSLFPLPPGARTSRTPARSTVLSLRRQWCAARARCRASSRRQAVHGAMLERQQESRRAWQRARGWGRRLRPSWLVWLVCVCVCCYSVAAIPSASHDQLSYCGGMVPLAETLPHTGAGMCRQWCLVKHRVLCLCASLRCGVDELLCCVSCVGADLCSFAAVPLLCGTVLETCEIVGSQQY
jgi:hypothetical protein